MLLVRLGQISAALRGQRVFSRRKMSKAELAIIVCDHSMQVVALGGGSNGHNSVRQPRAGVCVHHSAADFKSKRGRRGGRRSFLLCCHSQHAHDKNEQPDESLHSPAPVRTVSRETRVSPLGTRFTWTALAACCARASGFVYSIWSAEWKPNTRYAPGPNPGIELGPFPSTTCVLGSCMGAKSPATSRVVRESGSSACVPMLSVAESSRNPIYMGVSGATRVITSSSRSKSALPYFADCT